jgi:hypothetical protein
VGSFAVRASTTDMIDASTQAYDPLQRKSLPVWSLGEGLKPSDVFVYYMCDAYLRIPLSPDPCYVMRMHFLTLLDELKAKHGLYLYMLTIKYAN